MMSRGKLSHPLARSGFQYADDTIRTCLVMADRIAFNCHNSEILQKQGAGFPQESINDEIEIRIFLQVR